MNRRRLLGGAAALTGAALLDACASGGSGTALSAPSTAAVGSPPTPAPTVAGAVTPPTTLPPASVANPTSAPSSLPASTAPASTGAWSPGSPATYVNHGPAGGTAVALTFHFAGDTALVTRLLDLLKANGVRSTLFAIGDWITAHPDLARRALADGHELGNHTKSHQSMLKLGRAAVHAEIQGGAAELEPFLGSIGTWFRPSGTDVPNQVILDEVGKVGYPVSVGYDIDSRDYTEPGSRAVIDTVNAALHPGAIVSLHFGHTDTINALPAILTRLGQDRLHAATVSELLG